jgi:hypothetical protein
VARPLRRHPGEAPWRVADPSAQVHDQPKIAGFPRVWVSSFQRKCALEGRDLDVKYICKKNIPIECGMGSN